MGIVFQLGISSFLILGGVIGLSLFGIRDGLIRARRTGKTPPVDEIEAKKRSADRKKMWNRIIASTIALVVGLQLLYLFLRFLQVPWRQ